MPSAVLRMMFRSLRFAAIAPFRQSWYTVSWPASSGVDGQLTFYGLSTAAKRPTGARVCPRQPENRAARWKPLRALRSPESPAGTAGRGGAGEKPPTQHRTTENAPSKRGRPRAQPKPRPPEGEKGGAAAVGAGARSRRARSPRGAARRGEGRSPPRGSNETPAGGREAQSPRPQRRKGKRSAPAQSKGKGKRSGRSERRGSATARTKAERESGGRGARPGRDSGRNAPDRAREAAAGAPPERTSRASHGAARRQDAKRGKSPGNGAAEAGAGAQYHLWSAGNLPAREQPGGGGEKFPPGPAPEPSRQRSGSRWGHGLAWCNPVRRSLRAWCALQSLRRSRPCMPLENLP